ncbi:MAG TPA: hypothetical protein VJX92_13915 [Methylomirabilota bacterium]|nr:hypothetical protein [Methylomirabilota bacterium]
MTDEPTANPTIHLPAPEGHRRGRLQFRNGLVQDVDLSPEHLAVTILEFLASSGQPQLCLRDAIYGEPFVIPRRAIERELLNIQTVWIPKVAPQLGQRASGITVARDVPLDPAQIAAIEKREARRRRRLN